MSHQDKNIIGGIIFVFLGFIFITNLLFTSDNRSNKNDRVEQNLLVANKLQKHFILEYNRPAKTFDELAIGFIEGGNTSTSEYVEYNLDTRSKDLAIIGAKPIDREMYGFNGAVLRFKNAKGAIATASIICRSQNPGADGTDLTQAPVADAGKLRCAASWNDILVATKREQTQ